MKTFQARYVGWCPICHKKIEPGDWVFFDEDRNIVHATCNEEKDE